MRFDTATDDAVLNPSKLDIARIKNTTLVYRKLHPTFAGRGMLLAVDIWRDMDDRTSIDFHRTQPLELPSGGCTLGRRSTGGAPTCVDLPDWPTTPPPIRSRNTPFARSAALANKIAGRQASKFATWARANFPVQSTVAS
jgi:hypothetical protein